MSSGPITFRSVGKFQIYIFIVIIIGVIVNVDVARFTIVSIGNDPLLWILQASASITSMIFPIVPVIWLMRQQLQYNAPDWTFRTREVTFDEYRKIIEEYRSRYVHIISHFDIFYFALIIILGVLVIGSPFVLLIFSPYLVQMAPYLFGIFLIIFIIVFTRFIYGIIPTAASSAFSLTSPRDIGKGIALLSRSAGISWWAVKMVIGESDGFFLIKDAVPFGRIAGIEGDATITVEMKFGSVSRINAIIQWADEPITIEITGNPDTALRRLLLKVLYSYIIATDDKDTVAETLYDLGFPSVDLFLDEVKMFPNTIDE